MKIPQKILSKVLEEANKNARFNWYQGWDNSSGYIKTELRGDSRYGGCRIYCKWEKKKPPTEEQIKAEIEKYIHDLLENKQHHCNQRDFRHYLLDTFFVDVARLKHEAILSVVDNLDPLLKILEASDDFVTLAIQNLHNDLKNLQAGVDDHAALEQFLDAGKKRIGES